MEEPASTTEWAELPPETPPQPTAWPATLALSITFIFWGLASSLIISGVGLLVFAIALAGWIGNMRHERHDP